jgi:hypothetical protein
MQLKLQIFLFAGRRFIPREIPSLRLFTGPKTILSKRNVDINQHNYGSKLTYFMTSGEDKNLHRGNPGPSVKK